MKKIISLLLSLTMLLSIVSVVDLSACADTLTTGKCGDNVTYSFENDTGTLTISGIGDMYDCDDSNRSVFYNDKKIKTVVLKNGVTSIGDYAFFCCTSLISVIISNSVTNIGEYAFENCASLASMVIPDSVTAVGSNAFYNTGYYNNESNWDNGVLYISNCLINTNYDFDSVTDYAIKDGTRIVANHAFWSYDWTNLVNITMPNSVTYIGDDAFTNCKSLESVTISNSVISIGSSAFYNCESLASVTIPDNVTTIGSYAFYNTACYNNESNWENGVLYISNCLIDTNDDFKSTNDYAIKYGTKVIASSAFLDCASLKNIIMPNSVISIGDYAFYRCKNLKSIIIPNSVTNIGWSAFLECTSLTSVTIPNNVINISGHAFYGCTSLKSVIIGNSVTSIGRGAFEDCESLTSVTIPDSVTSIGDSAFRGCTNLISAAIPNSVADIGVYAFFYCKSLTSVTIPNSVKSIGNNAFYCCYFTFDNFVNKSACNATGATIVDTDADGFCIKDNVLVEMRPSYAIGEVSISNGVKSIGNEAFYCTRLTSITIPNSVTSIGNHAFCGCASLKDVYYTGTKAEWDKISIGGVNECLTDATIHYDSVDKKPTTQPPTTEPTPEPEPTPSPAPTPTPTPEPTPSPTPTPTQPTTTAPTQPTTTQTTTTKSVAKPKSASIKKVKAAKKAISVEWKKVSGVSGYEVQVATDKKFKKNKKTATVKKQKTTKVTVKKLKAKKKYYVRMRTYKTVNGKKVYSSWSKVKTIKTK